MSISRSLSKRAALTSTIAACLVISVVLAVRSDSAPGPARTTPRTASLEWLQETSDDASESLTGRALAEALGLRELDPIPEGQVTSDKQGCRSGIAEVPEGGVFCMDAVLAPSDPGYEAKLFVLGRALTGHEVTEDMTAEIEIFFAASESR